MTTAKLNFKGMRIRIPSFDVKLKLQAPNLPVQKTNEAIEGEII